VISPKENTPFLLPKITENLYFATFSDRAIWKPRTSLNFEQKTMDSVLNEFEDIIDNALGNILEEKGSGFKEWVDDVKKRMNDSEFQDGTKEEICEKLIKEMMGYVY
jgi:hypothetical protein